MPYPPSLLRFYRFHPALPYLPTLPYVLYLSLLFIFQRIITLKVHVNPTAGGSLVLVRLNNFFLYFLLRLIPPFSFAFTLHLLLDEDFIVSKYNKATGDNSQLLKLGQTDRTEWRAHPPKLLFFSLLYLLRTLTHSFFRSLSQSKLQRNPPHQSPLFGSSQSAALQNYDDRPRLAGSLARAKPAGARKRRIKELLIVCAFTALIVKEYFSINKKTEPLISSTSYLCFQCNSISYYKWFFSLVLSFSLMLSIGNFS